MQDVAQFLYHEARCLDNRSRWEEWVELFSNDGTYWMPYTKDQPDPLDTPSIVYEDKPLLAIRIGRLKHPRAWAQDPETRTARIVGNVIVEPVKGEALTVHSTFHMLEFRADRHSAYGGTYTHHLVRSGEGFRIKQKRVDLISADGIYEDIMQVLP